MTIQITRDRSRKMKHVVQVRQHALPIDEPVANGGEDLGVTAHELYDSALGACKAMTVLWYANRKQIPLEDIEVTVERDDSQERQKAMIASHFQRLAQAPDFQSFSAHSRQYPVELITPWIEDSDGRSHLCIPDHLGYPVTREAFDRVRRG